MTTPSMVTVPMTNELIFANRAELEHWDVYNKNLPSVLFLSIKGAGNSFLVHFSWRRDSRQQPGGHEVWKAITEKYSSRYCSGGLVLCAN